MHSVLSATAAAAAPEAVAGGIAEGLSGRPARERRTVSATVSARTAEIDLLMKEERDLSS